MAATVQVYIPVYNDITFLPKAVESVLTQSDVAVEIIVSDNASTDGTYEYATEMARNRANVRVYRNKTNIGHLANINMFKSYITAPFYMFLCSDDVLLDSTALKCAVDVMQAHPDVMSVYCDMDYIDAKDRLLARRKFRQEGVFDAGEVLKRSVISNRNLFGIPLLHRSAVATKVAYPEDQFYVGDLYHSARVAESGRVYHLPRGFIGNRYTGKNLTASLHKQTRSEFLHLARSFGLRLGFTERLRATFNSFAVGIAKQGFLGWAKLRSQK